MPVEDFHATELWKLGLNRWGINQQICGMLAVENARVHALTINRTHRGFEELERDLLNVLHPHLVTSYLNAIAFSRANESADQLRAVMETAPGAYGCLRDDGTLAWMQPRAREWLEAFYAGEAFAANGLPVTIEHDRGLRMPGTDTVHAEKVLGEEVLFLCLSPSPLGGTILRLERRAQHPVLRFKPLPLLSERENDTLRWMIEGKRNSEIGLILGISERTVEKHVEAILRALNAENRATAIVRAMERMAG
jgi:DNA-binding CsgD family transcriptional regulator